MSWSVGSVSPGLTVQALTGLCVLTTLTYRPAQANVVVIDVKRRNQTIWEAPDLPARFGSELPDGGVWAHLVDVQSDGCDLATFKPTPSNATEQHWMALVKRGNCQFDVKVFNAQKKKYYGAIVYNDESDSLLPMGGGAHAQEIVIPSVFIGRSDALMFKKFTDPEKYEFQVSAFYPPAINPITYLVPFIVVIGLCFIIMLSFMVIRWIRDVRYRQRSRLSRSNLKKIPVKKFKKGDQYDMCAICLDEYEVGEKLRILPCSHAYHQKCIDPWLTKNKKVCPICKRKVMPGDPDTDSDEDSDDDTGTAENTPLLGATGQSVRPSGLTTAGGTFDNSGLPASLRNQTHPLSYNEDSSDDDYSTSNYQSSVEIHSGNRRQPLVTVVTDGSDSEETESADSEDEDDDEPLVQISTDPLGGVDNPAIVVIDDHFNENSQDEPRALEATEVAVVDSVDEVSPRGRDQIV